MAFTLGSFALDSTLTRSPGADAFAFDSTLTRSPGAFPPYVLDSTQARTPGAFAPYVLDSTQTRSGGAISPFSFQSTQPRNSGTMSAFIVGGDGPSTLTWTPTGGAVATGQAGKSFTLNGSAVYDVSLYTIAPSGGAVGSGTAPVAATTVLQFSTTAAGGDVLSGTAPVTVNWTQRAMVGGSVLGGTAVVTTTSPVILGAITAKIPHPTAALANLWSYLVEASTLPTVRASITGNIATYLTEASTLPRMQSVMTGLVGTVGTASATLPVIKAALTPVTPVSGAVGARLPTVNIAALTGFAAINGAMAARVPTVQAQLVIDRIPAQVLVMVTNMLTHSNSMYAQYPYNSFAAINGKYYAAGPTGLFQMDSGDSDSGAPIDALFRFGQNDFGTEMQKRMSDCYAAMHSDNDMNVRFYVDESPVVEYTLGTYSVGTLKQRRVPVGKGLKGRFWQLEVENTNGGYFDFSTINLAAVPLSRRT